MLSVQEEQQESLEKKIESITKHCKSFIRKLLNDLSKNKPENANTICDYIIAEQIEFNIKDSTKIGKIKALVYLSRSCNDKKSFRSQSKIF
jgi:hypothetical protein